MTGRGAIKMRAKTHVEVTAKGKQRIVVTELPYQVNKARLIERMANLVREKIIEGITEIRDESSGAGIRVVIELKADAVAKVVLNRLYKHTQMRFCSAMLNTKCRWWNAAAALIWPKRRNGPTFWRA